MDMQMRHRLASCRAIIDSNVVSIRRMRPFNARLRDLDKFAQSTLLCPCSGKPATHMSLGNNQRVPRRYGIFVPRHKCQVPLIGDS